MVPGIVGVFIYCMIACDGNVSGALPSSTGGSLGWFIMHAINSGMGNTATLITNQPDIARWSTSKNAAITSQLFVQPIAVTLSATFGILATAGINRQWGLELWNPWDLLDEIQTRNNHPGARFAIFLAAFCWMIGILGTNIACNMIPFGSDSALLVPRFIDMRRGFFIVEFLAYAIVPWKIMASAVTFTTFLSGYGLFMASVVAIMIAECKSRPFKNEKSHATYTNATICRFYSITGQRIYSPSVQPHKVESALPIHRRLQYPSYHCLPSWYCLAFPWVCSVPWCEWTESISHRHV